MSDAEETTNRRPIVWQSPEGIRSKIATNLVVQHTEHEFILSFFEIKSPLILGTAEEKAEQLANIETVFASCVARIVITPGRMEQFLHLMKENFDNFVKKLDEEEQEPEEQEGG